MKNSVLALMLLAVPGYYYMPDAAAALTSDSALGVIEEKKQEKLLIRRGDTLNEIAKSQNLTAADLLVVNPQIRNPDLILAGFYLNLPNK